MINTTIVHRGSGKGLIMIYCGLPGAGKTTNARMVRAETMDASPDAEVVILDRDSTRSMMTGDPNSGPLSDGLEGDITASHYAITYGVLYRGGTALVAATNLRPNDLARWIAYGRRNGGTVAVRRMNMAPADAVKVCAARGLEGGRVVPEHIIYEMADQAGIGPDGVIPDSFVDQAVSCGLFD